MITIPVGFLTSQGTLGYGKLYNSYAVNLANFTPAGWHLPALSEYTTLGTTIGSNPGTHMKVPPPYKWNGVVPGDNSSGFSLYGAGQRNTSGGFNGVTAKSNNFIDIKDVLQFNIIARINTYNSEYVNYINDNII